MDKCFRRTTLIIAFSVAVVFGVASANAGLPIAGKYVLLACLLALVSAPKRKLLAFICLVLLGFTFGNWRGGVFSKQLAPLNDLYDQHVGLTAVAESDGVYSNNSQLAFDVGNVVISDPVNITIPGKLKIEGFGVNAVYRGDVVEVEGKLQDTLGSRQGRLSFADIKVLGRNSSFIETTRHNFTAGMQSALPEPQASFGMGLLIGEKTTLPKTVTNNLSAVGLTHIIAVSGYNLTIIVAAVRRLLIRRSKYQTTVIAIMLIAGFLLLTGFSASIVRAAIVSMLSIIAWYYGRKFRPMLLISFTAAVTALWNPLYIWGDTGWYLSFLAFYGVLVLAPLIHQRLPGKERRGVLGLLIIESLCAQIMTAPYIIYTFKQLSLLALPANLLVVPLVPFAMLLSLLAGLAGMIAAAISGWFAWPARIILTYMLDLAAVFARVPHALLLRSLSISELAVLYASIVLIGVILGRSIGRRGTITDVNASNF